MFAAKVNFLCVYIIEAETVCFGFLGSSSPVSLSSERRNVYAPYMDRFLKGLKFVLNSIP
jgi:hypothetical protein